MGPSDTWTWAILGFLWDPYGQSRTDFELFLYPHSWFPRNWNKFVRIVYEWLFAVTSPIHDLILNSLFCFFLLCPPYFAFTLLLVLMTTCLKIIAGKCKPEHLTHSFPQFSFSINIFFWINFLYQLEPAFCSYEEILMFSIHFLSFFLLVENERRDQLVDGIKSCLRKSNIEEHLSWMVRLNPNFMAFFYPVRSRHEHSMAWFLAKIAWTKFLVQFQLFFLYPIANWDILVAVKGFLGSQPTVELSITDCIYRLSFFRLCVIDCSEGMAFRRGSCRLWHIANRFNPAE